MLEGVQGTCEYSLVEAVRGDQIGVTVINCGTLGDRLHDVEGARVHGVPVVFAEWGYGSPAEAEGTIAQAATPLDLLPILLPEASAPDAPAADASARS